LTIANGLEMKLFRRMAEIGRYEKLSRVKTENLPDNFAIEDSCEESRGFVWRFWTMLVRFESLWNSEYHLRRTAIGRPPCD